MNEDAIYLTRRLHFIELGLVADSETATEFRADPPLHAVADIPQDQPLAHEWQRFKQVVGSLLAQGQTGRFVLIKDDQPLSIWDTQRDAVQAARLFHGTAASLVQEIQPFVRSLRGDRSCPH